MTVATVQEKYLQQVMDLYSDISKDPDPGEAGVQSKFQKLVVTAWKIFQNYPNEAEKQACEFIESFIANPVSPFNTIVGDDEFDAVLREYEPQFLEVAIEYWLLAYTNWNKLIRQESPEKAREFADEFINAPKFDAGIYGQLAVFK